MKKGSIHKASSALNTFLTIVALLAVAVSVFLLVQVFHIKSAMKQTDAQLAKIEIALKDSIPLEYGEQSIRLMDEVSIALGVVSTGVALFTVFGGVLSLFNISQAKQLEATISKTAEELDEVSKKAEIMEIDQRELASARLIQEGLVYETRNRYKYAVECFENAKATAPGSISAFCAEYEIIALRVDISKDEEELQNSCERAERLVGELEKLNNRDAIVLKADTCFILGCVYGNRYMENTSLEHLKKSEAYFQKAIQCDSGNVDFYRNLAISFALHNDEEKCKDNLMRAKFYSRDEPLYASLVEPSRLKKLFTPSWPYLSPDIKNMLHEEYSISLD